MKRNASQSPSVNDDLLAQYAQQDVHNQIAIAHRHAWLDIALDHQLPPEGDTWYIWNLWCGRGAGKTRAACEWLFWESWRIPLTRALVLAPTTPDLRGTNFEGESGLLNVIPSNLIKSYNKSTFELMLMNGSLIRGIGGESYERLRGPQFHVCHVDEIGAFQYPQQAFDLMMLGLRLPRQDDSPPRCIVTSTPRPIGVMFDHWEKSIDGNGESESIRITQASTYDNLQNLAKSFQEQILQYEDTDYGRQEIYGELIDPSESSIFKASYFKLWACDKPFPKFKFVVASFDTASSTKDYSDYSACCVLGVFQPDEDSSFAVMVIDAWRDKLEYPDLRDKIIAISKEVYGDSDDFQSGKKIDLVLVESAASGLQLVQELSRTRVPIMGRKPGALDKVQRAILVSPIVSHRKVYLPESMVRPGKPRDWLTEWMREITTFPNSPVEPGQEDPHDDQVDAFVHGLSYLRDAGLVKVDFFVKPAEYADDRKRKLNPYAQ